MVRHIVKAAPDVIAASGDLIQKDCPWRGCEMKNLFCVSMCISLIVSWARGRIFQLCSVLFMVCFASAANATLAYQLQSAREDTFGTLSIDKSLGEIYTLSHSDPDRPTFSYDLTVAGFTLTDENSGSYGGAWPGDGLSPSKTSPFGVASGAVTFGNPTSGDRTSIALGHNSVAKLDIGCGGIPAGCVAAVGGELVENITWELVTPTGKPPQDLYLSFGSETVNLPVGSDIAAITGTTSYNKPDSGLSIDQQNTVVQRVAQIYEDFNLNVTNTEPSSGEYSTIFIGGENPTIGFWEQLFGIGTQGVASSIDFGNMVKDDFALVFSDNNYFEYETEEDELDSISQVIAHEAGHILGLRHVQPVGELIHTQVSRNNINISDQEVNIAEFDQDGNIVPEGGTQNSHYSIGCGVGYADGTNPSGCDDFLMSLESDIDIEAAALAGAIYNPYLFIRYSDDVLPTISSLDEIKSHQLVSIQESILGDIEILLLGASMPGGVLDIFSGDALFGGAQAMTLGDGKLSDMFVPLKGATTLSFYQYSNGSSVPWGSAIVDLKNNTATIPIVSSLYFMMIGVAVNCIIIIKRKYV